MISIIGFAAFAEQLKLHEVDPAFNEKATQLKNIMKAATIINNQTTSETAEDEDDDGEEEA